MTELPDIKPPKKKNYIDHTINHEGYTVTGRLPVEPKGRPPEGGNRLMWRINPKDQAELQVKWNRKTSDWMVHSSYDNRAGARNALSIVTMAGWRMRPQTGTISRAKAG